MNPHPVDSGREDRGIVPRRFLIPFILLTSCFALWGLANNMTDLLLASFKRIMSMSDFQTSWIQVAFYGSYFCLALPAALFIRRYSYKSGLLLGLGLFALGALLFYPASITMVYGHFLIALFVLAGGLAILETTANPYALSMGPEYNATRRLNLAQAFNPIGSITGVLIGQHMILAHLDVADETDRLAMDPLLLREIQQTELDAVMTPYVVIALVIVGVWLVMAVTRFPYKISHDDQLPLGSTFMRLLRTPHYVQGVIAQFFYVGAQIGVWSFTVRYVQVNIDLTEKEASAYYLAAILIFSASRFICTGLMRYFDPRRLLWLFALMAALLCVVVILDRGLLGVYALVGISAFMSLMFPTIYGIALSGLGDATKVGASGLIMAIIGGAVLTAIQGKCSDLFSIHIAYAVPLVCFIVIALYGLFGAKENQGGSGSVTSPSSSQ